MLGTDIEFLEPGEGVVSEQTLPGMSVSGKYYCYHDIAVSFVIFGILLAIMPALSNASIRNKQRYVITNRRILIRKQMGVLAFAGEDLPPMKIREYREGKITISFGRIAVDEKKFHTTIFDFLLEKVSDLAGSGKSESAMQKEWAECMLENLPDADRVKNAI